MIPHAAGSFHNSAASEICCLSPVVQIRAISTAFSAEDVVRGIGSSVIWPMKFTPDRELRKVSSGGSGFSQCEGNDWMSALILPFSYILDDSLDIKIKTSRKIFADTMEVINDRIGPDSRGFFRYYHQSPPQQFRWRTNARKFQTFQQADSFQLIDDFGIGNVSAIPGQQVVHDVNCRYGNVKGVIFRLGRK
jgi:hypothetical protein